MSRKREQRLRNKLRRARRELADVKPIAAIAVRYVREIFEPDVREPYSIANWRDRLVAVVRSMWKRHGVVVR